MCGMIDRKMGYWVDMEDPYVTYKSKYMETVCGFETNLQQGFDAYTPFSRILQKQEQDCRRMK
jgi:hypothetical protein